MRFDTSQQMRMGQHMKLAPRMIQSMEILQMPMMQLQERIEQELESNIALEQLEPGSEPDQDVDGGGVASDGGDESAIDDSIERRELVVGDESGAREKDDWERLSNLESSYPQAFDGEADFPTSNYSAGTKNDIIKAIEKADLGLNPMSEGQTIRISVPAPSAERRQQLVGQVKKMAEDSKVAIRNERRDGMKHVETMVKDKTAHLSEDQGKSAKTQIEDMTKKHIDQIDQMCTKKSAEVTQI